MISRRSLFLFFRVNFVAWKNTNTPRLISINTTLQHFQKCKLSHGFGSCGLKNMKEDRKGKQRLDFVDCKKRGTSTQTWRAVSTQSKCHEEEEEGDGEKENVQFQMEEGKHGVSLTVSTSEAENRVLGEPEPFACPRMEGSNNDRSLEGKSMLSKKHSVTLEIGWSLMRFIKGKGGSTQEEIEEATGVKIIFPSSKKVDTIIIEGNSAESVTKASAKIQMVIDKAVNSREYDYSHFVSLPLSIHPGLVDKLVNFQNTILGIVDSDKDKNPDNGTGGDASEEEKEAQHSVKASKVAVELKTRNPDANVKVNIMGDQNSTKAPLVAVQPKAENADLPLKVNMTNIPLVSYDAKESKSPASETSSSKVIGFGVEKSIFIKPKTFHLTVLMLKLWNRERVEAAAKVLQSVSPKVIDALENRPVFIRLKGLDCMKGSLAKARVLYAPVEEIGGEGRLLHACQVIVNAFTEAGLVLEKDVEHKLKLHATLMNARHRKRKKGTTGGKVPDFFDARGIFDQYGSEEWGEYRICEAHLSRRFVFDENGYYHCCASIPFPGNMPEN